MKYIILNLLSITVFLSSFLFCQEEFIKVNKKNVKKKTACHVKEDVADLLEILLRQLGTNIQQSVVVQNQVIDKIKNMMNDSTQSTHQLKELRHALENYLKKLEEQQVDLQNFLSLCK